MGSEKSWYDRGRQDLYTQGLREQAKQNCNIALIHKKPNHHNKNWFTVCDFPATLVTFDHFLKGHTLNFLLEEVEGTAFI